MTMKFPCWEVWKKYSRDGCAKNSQTNGKEWSKELNEDHNS